MSASPRELLDVWFGGMDPEDPATGDQQASLWWGRDDAVDDRLRERFGSIHAELVELVELVERSPESGYAQHPWAQHPWAQTREGRVAVVLVLDQLSRNIHRGTPRVYAQDAAARRLVSEMIDRGEDLECAFFHRLFVYMPLEHSEVLRDQERCCRLFERMREDSEGVRREKARGYLDFAYRHRDIVARFGRFPHRNAILGRPSSAEELRFLEGPDSSF